MQILWEYADEQEKQQRAEKEKTDRQKDSEKYSDRTI